MAKKGYIQKRHVTYWLHTLLSCIHDDEDFNRTLADILKDKQQVLISGQNIKTINGLSLLGDGNIVITSGATDTPSAGGGGGSNTPSASPLLEVEMRGEYSPSATYTFFNIVTYDGCSYVCKSKEPVIGIAPTVTSYWQLLALRGQPGQDGKPGKDGKDGDTAAAEAIVEAILATLRDMPIEDAAIAAQIAANTAEIKSKADKTEVESLSNKIEEIIETNAVIGDTMLPDNFYNAYIEGEVGQTLQKVERTTYFCNRYDVTRADMVAVSMRRRNEPWWWVYFTDDDDVIISREIYSTETDYTAVSDQLLSVPAGATRMYVHSFAEDAVEAKIVTGAGAALHDYDAVKKQVYVNKSDIADIDDKLGKKNYIDGAVFRGISGHAPRQGFSCSAAIPVIGGRDIILVSNMPMDASLPDALKEFDAEGNEVDYWTSWGAGEERPITLSASTRWLRLNFLTEGQLSYIKYADGTPLYTPEYAKGSIIRDIADLKQSISSGSVPGDELRALSSEHVYLEGEVGSTIIKTERDTYLARKYAVSPETSYFVTLSMRNEPWYWCYFVDENDRIVGKTVASTATNYGNVYDMFVTAPAGARYMYIHSFNSTLLYANESTSMANGLIRVGQAANEARSIADKNKSLFFVGCEGLNNDGNLYSAYIPATLGDVVVWSSFIDNIEISMYEYDADLHQVDSWTCPLDERTVTIEHENTRYVRAVFSYRIDKKQFISVNGEELAFSRTSASSVDTLSALPDFVLSAARKTHKRLMEWLGEEDAFLMAHITDVHSGGSGKYKHVGYLNELNRMFSFDCLVNGGDIGLDTPDTTGNDDKVFELLSNTKAGMNCTSPWLFCRGNHERLVGLDVTGNVFNLAAQRQFPDMVLDETGNYGYLDIAHKHVRVIFLNTTDAEVGNHYGVSKSQLLWLISTLRSTRIGWHVVLTMHLCIDPIGRWKSYQGDADGSAFDSLREILRCFSAKTSGGNAPLDLSWDFTLSKASLSCCLCGDSHFNNYVKRQGVNYIVRQGYGGISQEEIADGGSVTAFDANDDCCFDVLAIKRSGSAKVFRIGAGDSANDLSFSFVSSSQHPTDTIASHRVFLVEQSELSALTPADYRDGDIILGLDEFFADDGGNEPTPDRNWRFGDKFPIRFT